MTSLRELLRTIRENKALRDLKDELSTRLSKDPGHNLDHALRVALWTLRIGGESIPKDQAIAAALCHDLVNVSKKSKDRAKASTLSARAARDLLPNYGFTGEALDNIARAIVQHSYSSGAVPDHPLAIALQDADRLEALGSIGILRTISTGTLMGCEYVHLDDPWAEDRPLNDKAYMIDHFFEKLLKLPDTLLTEIGRQEAKRRIKVMQSFLNALKEELA